MSNIEKFEMPSVTDDEIRWVSGQLGMKTDAFFGADGADMRATVLKSMECTDVAACPGSGKTTLLVGKLAILAAKWPYRTRGLCVLSHTNVARIEIEKRLGHTAAGRRLLSHPHFIGTIHGFVNEFLAIPWLHSLGYLVRMIDTDSCLERRWRSLSADAQYALKKGGHTPSILVARAPNFNVGEIKWAGGKLGIDTPLYQGLCEACKKSAQDGFFCYDEMFMWAHDLIDKVPGVIETMRGRFPMLLLDEAQDTKDEQARIIHRIFTEGATPVTRQRFGDGNQAIFDSTENEATGNPDLMFPLAAIQRDLPTSHRFGQIIANLADPLGIQPYILQGKGPKKSLSSGVAEAQHTIYLFDSPDGAARVLPAFGKLLLDTFSAIELRAGLFKAVGQVHQNKGDDHFPGHLGHYWRDYDPALSRAEPKPQTFVQYVFAGVGKAATQGESHQAVEKIAEGVLRFAALAKGGHILGDARERQRHRQILRLLKLHTGELEKYQEFIVLFGVERQRLTKELWNTTWRAHVKKIAETIGDGPLTDAQAQTFLEWKDGLADGAANGQPSRRENFQCFAQDKKEVTVYFGSIHSAKGETHTATLVLETFWYSHNMSSIKDWLLGKRSGGAGAKDTEVSRLKLHYVAMTRPSHLLCLALPKSALFAKAKDGGKGIVDALKLRGWAIHEL